MTPEGQIKRDIKKYLALPRANKVFWSMVTGGAYSKIGDPDMILCYRGRYIAAEVKAPGGRQSDWQKLRMQEIINAGGIYILAKSVDDIAKVLDKVDREADDAFIQEKKEESGVQKG